MWNEKKMKHLISMQDISKEDILHFVDVAGKIENGELTPDLNGQLAALLFFEPSTRTKFSFETAMKKLGGTALSLKDAEQTSLKKGESLHDTLMTISQYVDLVIMRSPIEGSARYASEILDIPVINAGDGANQHPTQALLDMYSIKKTQGKLDNLNIAMVGDLKFGRTVHSLSQALSDFSPNLYFISPGHLKMPEHIKNDLKSKNVNFEEYERIEDVIDKLDIMYVTRIQKERFTDPEEYEKVKNLYIVDTPMLNNVKDTFKIMHPLPRVNEITMAVDKTKYAYYFEQVKNGVYMRQAIISILLKGI